MTYNPTVRNRFNKPLYQNTRGAQKEAKRNAYWEGYLSDEDGSSSMISGYDFAAEAADNVFHNLEVYETALIAAGLIDENEDFSVIDENVILDDKELEAYSEDELNKMTPLTKAVKAFKEILNDWLEGERNNLIVSTIEGMDEEEYQNCIRKADDDGYENIVMRSYPKDLKEKLQGKGQ